MEQIFPTLTGRWLGRYDYPRARAPVSFEAEVEEDDGAFTGMTLEPNTFRRDMGTELSAKLIGSRNAEGVTFVKYYVGFGQNDDPIYEGVANPALTRIAGVWRFTSTPGWSGRFILMRKPMAAVSAERSTAAEADRAWEDLFS